MVFSVIFCFISCEKDDRIDINQLAGKWYVYNDDPNLAVDGSVTYTFDVDWNWLTQDFHLFVHRNILKLYKPRDTKDGELVNITGDFEPISIEGKSKLAVHMRYERDSGLIVRFVDIHSLRNMGNLEKVLLKHTI